MSLSLPDGLSTQLPPELKWTHVACVDSTNTYLLDASQSVNQLFSADRQNQGRGRRQQQWIDEGESALFSLSTAFTVGNDISAWPVQVAITLADSLNALFVHYANSPIIPTVKVKWPNDLYIQYYGQYHEQWGKAGGILVESSLGHYGKVVTGVGLNLMPLRATVAADYKVAFIDLPLAKKTLIAILGHQLFTTWQAFVQNPCVNIDRYRQHDCLFGKDLVATNMHNGEQHRGIGAGINSQGHLLLQQGAQIHQLTAQQQIRFADE